MVEDHSEEGKEASNYVAAIGRGGREGVIWEGVTGEGVTWV